MKKLYDPSEGVSLKVRFLGSLIVVIFIILLGIVVMFVARPYYNDGRALGVPFLILLSGTFLLLAFAFRRQMLRVVKKPTTPINTLSSGDVEIVGKVKPVGKTIISPTGQNCVYYAAYWIDTVVVSRTSENTHTASVQVGHEVSNSSFIIIDQYGEAELDFSDVQYHSVQGLWINEFKSIKCSNSKRNPIGGKISDSYNEFNLKAGDDFYYNGVIEEYKNEIAPLPPIINDQPPLLTKIPTGAQKWKLKGGILGNKPEVQIKNKYKIMMVGSFIFSMIFLVLALNLHMQTSFEKWS